MSRKIIVIMGKSEEEEALHQEILHRVIEEYQVKETSSEAKSKIKNGPVLKIKPIHNKSKNKR